MLPLELQKKQTILPKWRAGVEILKNLLGIQVQNTFSHFWPLSTFPDFFGNFSGSGGTNVILELLVKTIFQKYCISNSFTKLSLHIFFRCKNPTFRKNDRSATWKPNRLKKNFACGQLRNGHGYQKYHWLVRSFFLRVSDWFKPTVYYDKVSVTISQ